MAHRGETIENPLTGERMTFLETTAETNGRGPSSSSSSPRLAGPSPSTSIPTSRSARSWSLASSAAALREKSLG